VINMVYTYALHDSDKANHKGTTPINRNDAKAWNERGFGIFHTVQSFKSNERKVENLIGINAWAIDIDEGTKEEQMQKIKTGLKPTMVVETRNGFHVYWACDDKDFEISKRYYSAIVANRLVPYYNGDKRAKDLCRLLRVPGFYHMKDPANPFLIEKKEFNPIKYTSQDMLDYYKDLEAPKEYKRQSKALISENIEGKAFFDRLYAFDQQEALSRFSGHDLVNGEIFTFKPSAKGKRNIFVNGKGTSTFICSENRIGSMDGGGPTIFQWLKYYGNDSKVCINEIKKLIPEVGA